MSATLQSPGEQLPLDNTMGAMLIGCLVSGPMFGISVLQLFHYIYDCPDTRKDPALLKYLVSFIVVLDAVHYILISHSLYYYLVLEYYNQATLNIVIWSVTVEALPTSLTGAIVQCYYAYKMWKFSGRRWGLASPVVILVLLTIGCGIAWFVFAIRARTYSNLLKISPLTITINVLTMVTDVYIALTLCYMFFRSRTGIKRTDTMVNKLIGFFVTTGFFTGFVFYHLRSKFPMSNSLCAILSLVSLVAWPKTLIYASFYFCLGRLYTNSILASLNARSFLRGKNSADMITLNVSALSSNKSRSRQPVSIQVDTIVWQDNKAEERTVCDLIELQEISAPVEVEPRAF